jgi:putative phosphonate metabolism protein
MAPEGRVAVYYAPSTDDPLFAAGSAWLGRDPRAGTQTAQPDLSGISEITAEPRRYGFHATLKPPMRLNDDRRWSGLLAATAELAGRVAPFVMTPLAVTDVHGFLALRETAPCPPLQALADTCVEQLDHFRAPPDEAELARRRRARLSAEQETMLMRWGYPYVFGTWFFHMTLTRRLTPEEKRTWQPAAERFFAAAAREPRAVRDICLFVQASPGAPFILRERLPLRG